MIHSAQATLPNESDQLRLECHQGHSARSQVAHIDEVIHSAQATLPNESDQLRLERHQGHSARSPATHFDEFVYSRQVTLPEESVQLRQVSRWRSATRINDLSQKQVMQPGNQFNSGKSADGDQQLALTTSAKSRSCSLGISSTQASQPMENSSSHRRPQPKVGHAAKESIRLIQASRWRSAARIDDLSQKQVMQPGNQFNSGKSADGEQQLA